MDVVREGAKKTQNSEKRLFFKNIFGDFATTRRKYDVARGGVREIRSRFVNIMAASRRKRSRTENVQVFRPFVRRF